MWLWLGDNKHAEQTSIRMQTPSPLSLGALRGPLMQTGKAVTATQGKKITKSKCNEMQQTLVSSTFFCSRNPPLSEVHNQLPVAHASIVGKAIGIGVNVDLHCGC